MRRVAHLARQMPELSRTKEIAYHCLVNIFFSRLLLDDATRRTNSVSWRWGCWACMKLKFIASTYHQDKGWKASHLPSPPLALHVCPLSWWIFGKDGTEWNKNSRTDETKNADNKGRCLAPNNILELKDEKEEEAKDAVPNQHIYPFSVK